MRPIQSPPTQFPPKRVRLTISLPWNVHQVYTQMAESSGRSIGWEIGEWLDATLQAAEATALQIAAARDAPRQAVAQIEGRLRALQAVHDVAKESSAGGAGRRAEPGGAGRAVNPPSGNTGGKGTKSTAKRAL
jgi:hypothetical protein